MATHISRSNDPIKAANKIFLDINKNAVLEGRELDEGLLILGTDYDFFAGCEKLFQDYITNPCKVTQLEQLPLWALDILGDKWKSNYGRIQLGSNGLAVFHSRYARCWAYVDDAKTEPVRELKGQTDATKAERERGLIFEPVECMFYRIAMTSVAVIAHREIRLLRRWDGDIAHLIEVRYRLESKAIDMFTAMAALRFVPAGRILKNAGAGKPVVANCVVLDLESSTLDNYAVLNEALRLQEYGSGVGFPFHCIEPGTANSSKIGAMGFLVAADAFLGCIEEDGRKGANMAVMSVEHPDILDFIQCKSNSEFALPNFNVSVSLSDRFMEQVVTAPDEPWMCLFEGEYYLPRIYSRKKNGMNIESFQEVNISTRDLFDKLVGRAYCFGDPGCVFLDTVNKLDPSGLKINASNPCGEQFLPSGDVCVLGSLNLDAFYRLDTDAGPCVDMELYRQTIRVATEILDCTIDMTKYHSSFRDSTRRNYRRIGLGIMGLADLLYQLRIPYDTLEARTLGAGMMETATTESMQKSSSLAKRYGVFAAWEKSKWASGYLNHPPRTPMRNVSLTTIPPTGSISMLAGVSSGCEPNFSLAYEQRHILDGKTTVTTFNRRFYEALHKEGYWTEEIERKICQKGDLSLITQSEIPDSFRNIFSTAMSISGDAHLQMLIRLQKYTMNAVSKTINLPFEATANEIGDIYMTAWMNGCKGLTVYRDGSRTVQILNKGMESKTDVSNDPTVGVANETPPNSSSESESVFDYESLQIRKSFDRWDIPCRTPNCEGPVTQLSPTCFICLSCSDEGCVSSRRKPVDYGNKTEE